MRPASVAHGIVKLTVIDEPSHQCGEAVFGKPCQSRGVLLHQRPPNRRAECQRHDEPIRRTPHRIRRLDDTMFLVSIRLRREPSDGQTQRAATIRSRRQRHGNDAIVVIRCLMFIAILDSLDVFGVRWPHSGSINWGQAFARSSRDVPPLLVDVTAHHLPFRGGSSSDRSTQ